MWTNELYNKCTAQSTHTEDSVSIFLTMPLTHSTAPFEMIPGKLQPWYNDFFVHRECNSHCTISTQILTQQIPYTRYYLFLSYHLPLCLGSCIHCCLSVVIAYFVFFRSSWFEWLLYEHSHLRPTSHRVKHYAGDVGYIYDIVHITC